LEPARFRGNIYNAGTNKPTSVVSALEAVYRLTGNENSFGAILEMMSGKKTTGEIECQFMGFEKVEEHFGWRPRHTFEAGLTKTIEWFKWYLSERYQNKGDFN